MHERLGLEAQTRRGGSCANYRFACTTQFNDVSSGAASAPAAASGTSDAHTAGADTATKHDDLVASESSSNEDESESESESDMD